MDPNFFHTDREAHRGPSVFSSVDAHSDAVAVPIHAGRSSLFTERLAVGAISGRPKLGALAWRSRSLDAAQRRAGKIISSVGTR